MSMAHNPAGRLLTYDEAAALTGKHLATIYRWAAGGHIRRLLGPEGDERVSEADVMLMLSKKWTRQRKN